jgi:glutamyl-tRNA synthetase
MNNQTNQTVTRFAPSPTGLLHIGGARTALFCWAFARKTVGRFLIRIEDTDTARSSDASERAILEALAWLGINWDDGPPPPGGYAGFGGDDRNVAPFHQSQRAEIYDKYFNQLLDAQLAYPAFDSPEELDAMRAEAQAAKQTFRYTMPDGYDLAGARKRAEAGEKHVLRLRTPEEPITVTDEVLGEINFTTDHYDDFVIRKADGMPTYHFAVVVDDALMGVTHVLRGQEHLNNTPKHIALQHALGFDTPVYAHMPLIFNAKGAKMSKREQDQAVRAHCKDGAITAPPKGSIENAVFEKWIGDKKAQLETDQLQSLAIAFSLELPEVSVDDFRAAGYLPEVITNFISLLGWTPSKHDDGSDREKFDMDFLAEDFELSRIGKSNARFDRDKLMSFNQDAIGALEPQTFITRYHEWSEQYAPDLLAHLGDRFEPFARMVHPRAKTFAHASEPGAFVFIETDSIEYNEKNVKKFLLKGEPSGLDTLASGRAMLGALEDFSPEPIEAAIKSFCETNEIGMGKLAQPLRIAMTGSAVSPGLGDTLSILGKQTVLGRIDRCLSHHSAETA